MPVPGSEVADTSEALGKIKSRSIDTPPNVSEKSIDYIFESQLSFDLKYDQMIASGNITAPSHEEAIQKDFNYALKTMVDTVLQDVDAQKECILALNSSRKKKIAYELENIISELNDFMPIPSVTPDRLHEIMYAPYESLEGKGLQVFCSRISYFMTLRLLLIHYWENLGLISDTDKNPYLDPNLTIHHRLNKSCENLVKEKYNWLFAKQNNYSWYKTSSPALDEMENVLAYWQFKEDSISIASQLYERYLDENKLRKYAHYTPPILVRFIWDFLNDLTPGTTLFRMLGRKRIPKLIFDPTMGSGNFLIEAARIMKKELDQTETDPKKKLNETLLAFTTGLYGCDIDVFAHFFSEIKLLWMLSPLFKQSETLKLLPHQRVHPSLSIIHQNALKLYNQEQLDMVDMKEDASLSMETRFGIMPLEGHLKAVHSKIRLLEKFDYCVGCPPERILNEQKSFMKELIDKIPYWKKYYQSNLLYSSWFFVLGLSKLREGGKLVYLTETYWPTEDGGSKLRHYLLSESKVLAVIDLGRIKLEEDTTLLPRYITLLEKCSSKEERDKNKIKIIKVPPQEDPALASFILGKILTKTKVVDQPGKLYSDDEVEIYYSGIQQGELDEKPWQQIYDTGFSHILKQILSYKTTLNYFCAIEENHAPDKGATALITPELSPKNKFGIYEKNPEAGNFLTLTLKPISKESPYYLMALLNSPVLNFWFENNGNKINGKKLYEAATLKMIPIRPIDFGKPIEASLRTEKLAQIDSAIKKFDEKYLMANLNLELTHGREEIVHDAIVLMQQEIIEMDNHLKRYDVFFTEKISEIGDMDFSSITNARPFRQIYPPDKQCALKDHKHVFIDKNNVVDLDQFCLTHFQRQTGIKNEGEHLILVSKNNKLIKIYAHKELMDFMEADLKDQIHNFWNEIEASIFIPIDVEEFAGFREDIISHCVKLKGKQLAISKITHELIYKLYGFNVDNPNEDKSKAAQKAIEMMAAGF